jgi:hypothetical protein
MLRFDNCCLSTHSGKLVMDPDFVQRCEIVLGKRVCRDDRLLDEVADICGEECDQFTSHCGYPRGSSKCDALFRILSKRPDTASCNLPGDVFCNEGADQS